MIILPPYIETIQKFKQLKKSAHLVLMNSLEKAIWNWMDTYPYEFADIQRRPNEDLAKACEELFDILDVYVDNKKGRNAALWPLQIMLLVLSPKVLEEIVNADAGVPISQKHEKKRQFINSIKQGLATHGSSSRHLVEAAAVTCVKLCKASTYINNLDSNNVIFKLVQQVMNDLTSLLFNPSKQFSRGQNYIAQDVDLMIDCFVSCFRIKPNNNKVLTFEFPLTYQFVLVSSLYK